MMNIKYYDQGKWISELRELLQQEIRPGQLDFVALAEIYLSITRINLSSFWSLSSTQAEVRQGPVSVKSSISGLRPRTSKTTLLHPTRSISYLDS